jgi:uracil-DNA glycosylase family 4
LDKGVNPPEGFKPKHPLSDCWNCPYRDGTAFVPSQIPIRPRLMVLGEAPGPQEARIGIPFMGPSGDLLNKVLKYHGVDRSEVLVTNVCLCRPHGPTEVPPKAAIAACRTRLQKEIADSNVSTIIAVGNTAAKEVLDDSRKITSVRVGPPRPSKIDPNISVIPTWHPAYCLRSPDAFPSFVSDVGKIRGVGASGWSEPQWRVFDDPNNVLEVLNRLEKITDRVVIDIEGGVEKDFNYAHPEDYTILCVGLAYARRKAVVIGEKALQDPRVVARLREFLGQIRIIAHNGKFDLRGLSPLVGIKRLWFDTMLASYSLDERPGQHGLEVLSIEKLGAPSWKNVIKKYMPRGKSKNYANIPRPVLYKYNAYDVSCTWDLYEMFFAEMDDRAKQAHDFMVRAANELIHPELSGIKFDHDYSYDLATDFISDIEQLEEKINGVVGYEINPKSVPQVTNYYHKNKIFLKTTAKDFLVEVRPKLTGAVGEFTDLLLEHRRVSKLFGTYVKGLSRRTTNGKIYTTYLLHGTTSGRLASRNPNMQNIDREKRIRDQFTVECAGNVLVQADYSQAEGRVITTLARDDYLASIFNDPTRDIFNELTSQIYGNSWGEEERVKVKSFFYGLSYGRGAASIGREFDMPLTEATELLNNFKALIPKTVQWQANVTQRVLGGEDLVTPFGRKRSFYLITNENRKDVINEALSFLPQSIASDICLSALITLRPMLHEIATVRLTVHDAIYVECTRERAPEVAEIMKTEMVAAGREFTDYVPFAVDVKYGTRLGSFAKKLENVP